MTTLNITREAIAAILAEVEAAEAEEACIVCRPTVTHRLFQHWFADASEAGAVAETVAQVERRDAEVHYLSGNRVIRIDVHHPDGSISRPALFREPGATLITGIVL